MRDITVPWNRSVCERRADYRSASAAAPWPSNQALALRTARATSDARRPATVLKRRPNCHTVSTHPSPMTPSRSRIGPIWAGIVPRSPTRSCRPSPFQKRQILQRPSPCEIGTNAQDEMDMVAHDGTTADIDREDRGKLLEPLADPFLAVLVIMSGFDVEPTKERPTNASRDAMIAPNLLGRHDLMRVLKVIDAPWFKIIDGTGAFSTASAKLLRNRRFRSNYLGHAHVRDVGMDARDGKGSEARI